MSGIAPLREAIHSGAMGARPRPPQPRPPRSDGPGLAHRGGGEERRCRRAEDSGSDAVPRSHARQANNEERARQGPTAPDPISIPRGLGSRISEGVERSRSQRVQKRVPSLLVHHARTMSCSDNSGRDCNEAIGSGTWTPMKRLLTNVPDLQSLDLASDDSEEETELI